MIYNNVLEKFLKDQSVKLANKNANIENENLMLQSLMMKAGGNTETKRTVRIRRFVEGGMAAFQPDIDDEKRKYSKEDTEERKRLRRVPVASTIPSGTNPLENTKMNNWDDAMMVAGKRPLTQEQIRDYASKHKGVSFNSGTRTYADFDENGNIIEGSETLINDSAKRKSFNYYGKPENDDKPHYLDERGNARNPYFYGRPMGKSDQLYSVKPGSGGPKSNNYFAETQAIMNSMSDVQKDHMRSLGITDPRQYFESWGSETNTFKMNPSDSPYVVQKREGGSVSLDSIKDILSKKART